MTRAFLIFFFGVSIITVALALSPSHNTEIILPRSKGKVIPPPPGQIIPPDRNFAWNPGMMSKGGIPNRTTVCSTLSPKGTITLTASAATSSGATLTFSSVPASINVLAGVKDLTHPTAIASVNTVVSTTGTTVTISSGVSSPGVSSGDSIQFNLDDSVAMQAAIEACPAGQVLSLAAGTFTLNNGPILDKGITIRGAGAGVTKLNKQNGAHVRTSVVDPLTNGLLTPEDRNNYASQSDYMIYVGHGRYPFPDGTTSQNLTADGVQGASSVTIANATNFVAGSFVLLDELTNASWQPVPAQYGCSYNDVGQFTASISGTTMTVTSVVAINDTSNPINKGYVIGGAGVAANTVVTGQLSGTTGKVGTYSVSVSQTVGSEAMTGSGPCPPLVWKGDRVQWRMYFPKQNFTGDHRNSDIDGPYETTPGDTPSAYTWFSRSGRMSNEIKEIASVSGNTITFTSPLIGPYRTSHGAQLTRYTITDRDSTQLKFAGIEKLSVSGNGIDIESCAYCWVKNVEVTAWFGEGIAINSSFRVEIRDSYIHAGGWPVPGGGGYIISLANGTSEMLIENNILIDDDKQMVARASGAGSVVAYNYADDSWIWGSEGWVEVGLNASHMAGPHHVLFEGNYSQNWDSDNTHGNAIDMTVFRNWFSGQRRDFTPAQDNQNVRVIGADGAWWSSFIGNLLGRPGQMAGWQYTDPAMACDANGNNCTGTSNNFQDHVIWTIGRSPGNFSSDPDPQTLATMIRDGNYDFLTNSQRWHNTPGGFAMPNSMYLASKPAFFGSNPWPWTDPSNGTIGVLPAKARYDAGTPNSP